MNSAENQAMIHETFYLTAIQEACHRIAPTWPLDRWIAVNPWWGHKDQPAAVAHRELLHLNGTGMLMPPAFYLTAWREGRITTASLRAAASECGAASPDADNLVRQLEQCGPDRVPFVSATALLMARTETPYAQKVRHLVGRVCSQYFDQRQARWTTSHQQDGLYRYWLKRAAPLLGRSLEADRVRHHLGRLSGDWQQDLVRIGEELVGHAPQHSGLSTLSMLSHHLMLQVLGWASWCRGEDFRNELDGQTTTFAPELAVSMLVCEWLAVETLPATALEQLWLQPEQSGESRQVREWDELLWTWHRAYERAWQDRFLHLLGERKAGVEPGQGSAPEVQAAFCIDVRSEVMRRRLEEVSPGVQTLGVAGFFGMPVCHGRQGPEPSENRLPGLLAPSVGYQESTGDDGLDRQVNDTRYHRQRVRDAVRRAKYSSLSTFTVVETTGLAWAWKLVRDSLKRNPGSRETHESGQWLTLDGQPLPMEHRVDLAEGLLRAMSLTTGFAPLLLLVGHGAHADNNPNQAGLACGACGGKNGGMNARLAAELLNEPRVRQGLAGRGIHIPESTLVLAAEHCTITDRVQILDESQVSPEQNQVLRRLKAALAKAGEGCRSERAAALGLAGSDDEELLRKLEERTRNWAEVRPEWGLANNAAMIIAPRHRTRGLALNGRTFLHDYRPGDDPSGEILGALMNAPMVVANWINLQYFASVTQPEVYGAGNKLLHSVVGGNIGVVEGNSMDLRIGLPWQSVHDGERFRHEPMRLTVVIDAPADRIQRIIEDSPNVRALVENQWLWLCRFTDTGVERFRDGQWQL
ncbi:hypothetical protein SAMN05216429_109106 [Marinobacter persicus]|uniref:Probable inorganic carbon transporter subunit DabA n=1 Tax=Marinobacter persicus TaxID=930118 RepID=A0A1I3WA20_9GAMM|nr:DUF2309 domain-containing protein [Marinobacter persicus]GHD47225.1 UPF0753 protein [Marinobacter persicus]SFK04524.1 hypothetical protein SAMN05216429_109106 [Marinobacter persicus]